MTVALRKIVEAPASNENVKSIELEAIDLLQYKEGNEFLSQRKELAAKLQQSITTHGFFNLVNYGISPEFNDYIRSLAYTVTTLPEEEQARYLASAPKKELETTSSPGGERGQGFKPKGYWAIKDGVRDSIVHYNFKDSCHSDFVENTKIHPPLVREYIQDIADYFNVIHREILPKLLSLCDLILQIPEGTLQRNYFVKWGGDSDDSKSHGRFMLYQPYNAESSEKTEKTWLRGHSDISGFSFITSQPINSLQIRDLNGEWRYVKHRPQSLVVNIGDAMEFISGGLFKACLHRVVEPPKDQSTYERLAVIYFCNPSATADLDPELLNSPYLKELQLDSEHKLKHWEKIQFHHWNYVKGHTLGRALAGDRNLVQYFGRTIERWHH